MTTRAQYYRDILTKNVCSVTFEKTDGTTRVMNCTLNPNVTRYFKLSSLSPVGKQSDNHINVVDTDLGEWRSFRIDRIRSFKILSGSMDDLPSTPSRSATSTFAQPQDVPSTPVANHSTTPSMTTKNFYIMALKDGVCEISFTKADGSQRVMRGTLDPHYITLYHLEPVGGQTSRKDDGDTIRVVDIDVQDWRSFKVSRVQSFRTAISPPPSPTTQHTSGVTLPPTRTKLGVIPI